MLRGPRLRRAPGLFLCGLMRWLDEAAVHVEGVYGDEVLGIVQADVAEVEEVAAEERGDGFRSCRAFGARYANIQVTPDI